jgi:hypothetical protein
MMLDCNGKPMNADSFLERITPSHRLFTQGKKYRVIEFTPYWSVKHVHVYDDYGNPFKITSGKAWLVV